jgi:hypothetical protein
MKKSGVMVARAKELNGFGDNVNFSDSVLHFSSQGSTVKHDATA